ncbi:ABC transporter permease [Treponema maltophilum]|uniref:ABC transporter permease n=1 Tax=Treponema maltophilum TaxID=51160 RepID=UPI003D8B49CC
MRVSLSVKDKNFNRLLIVLFFVFILSSILKPGLFLRGSNFVSMARQIPEFGIMAIGISFTMLTGGIDLSTVYAANLSSIIAAKLMLNLSANVTSPHTMASIILLSICVALLVGSLCGVLNGLLISKIGIPAILATLGTQQLFWGIAIVITAGKSISGLPMMYFEFGNTELFGFIPISLIFFIIVAMIASLVLSKTKFGARLYLLGTNAIASKFAGLNNDFLIIMTYAFSGILASISGLIMMASTNSTKADYGSSYTMQCILIAVMGGINPNGGSGNIKGVVLVVIILQMLSSVLNMFENISNFYRDIIWGGALLGIMVFNYVINKRKVIDR